MRRSITRRSGFRLVVLGASLAVPLALLPAYSSQAAPTLSIAQAQAEISALQTQQDAAVEAYDQGVIEVASANAAAKQAAAQVKAASATLQTMENGLAAFATAAYTTGGADGVDGLLSGTSPQTLLSRAANLNEVARQSDDAIVAVTSEQDTLDAVQLTATDKARDAAKQAKELDAAKTAVDNLIAQQTDILDKLQANQRAQLVAEQAAAQQAAATAGHQAASRDTFRAPIAAVASGPVPSASGIAEIVLQAAYSQMGKPYQYGAAGPNSYDCSGLVMWAFAHAGIALPHSAAAQYNYGTHVSESQFEPGDLVFYDEGGYIGHVGIYVGNGEMIDANHTGGWVGVRPLYSGLIGGTRL